MQQQKTQPKLYTENLYLTQEDVQRLLQDRTSDVRIEITAKIAHNYNTTLMTRSERTVAEQIFRLLARDAEVRVRTALAENIKESDRIPRDIILQLTQDVNEVALPVLQYSEVLSDEDLLDLLHHSRDITRYLAIAKRKYVSGLVSDTLIEQGDGEVAKTLVGNEGAEISERGYDALIGKYSKDQAMMEAMSGRPLLPIMIVDKLTTIVSSELSEALKTKYKTPSEEIEKEVEKTREGETLQLIRNTKSQYDIDALVVQLMASDRLTPSIILSALCQGDFAFFETSLAKLSSISVSNARTLISDRGELGFRAIYNKSGLSDAMFPAVKLLLRVVRELATENEKGKKRKSGRISNRIVERLLQYSEENKVENLSYIIALVRRVA